MSYSNDKGKYQKAYDFLFKKLVPQSGRSMNNLGEALRLVSKVYYRLNNDGDSYDDCIEQGMVSDFSEKRYPFENNYNDLGRELDYLLSNNRYDEAVNIVLLHIMLSLSSESNIYNPENNRLVPINSAKGQKALKDLDINSIFINYCGKNQEWLPESLRKEGVKISKTLSEETRKELNCDTIQEFYRDKKTGYDNQVVKVTLSKDNTILSKKFSKIKSQHKKSVRAEEKKMKELQRRRQQNEKKSLKYKLKNYNITKLFHEQLKDLTEKKRVDSLKNMLKSKSTKGNMAKMLLTLLIEYKEKVVETKVQRQNKSEVIKKLTNGLNELGKYILESLSYHTPHDTLYSYTVRVEGDLYDKLDNLLVDILGSSEAVDTLYNRCKH